MNKELTLEQALELNHRSQLYGIAFAIKYKNGDVKIIGLNEEIKEVDKDE